MQIEAPYLDESEMQQVYNWVDEIPLSRPKKNIARDFCDAVLAAEIVHHFFPKMVEIHNYSGANSYQQKMYNWNTLNQKVLKKMGFMLCKSDIENCVNCVNGAIERVLKLLQNKMAAYANKVQSRGLSQEQNFSPPAQKTQNNQGSIQQQPYRQADVRKEIDSNVLAQKEQTIQELKETIEIMELKIKKLEQLIRLKDSKIQNLTNKLAAAGIQ